MLIYFQYWKQIAENKVSAYLIIMIKIKIWFIGIKGFFLFIFNIENNDINHPMLVPSPHPSLAKILNNLLLNVCSTLA